MNQREQDRGANYQYRVKRRDFNRAAHTARLARVPPSAQLRRAALIIAPTNPSPGAAVFALSPRGADRAPCRQSSPLSAPCNGAWSPFPPRENNFLWDAPVSITRNSLSPPKTSSFAPGTDGSRDGHKKATDLVGAVLYASPNKGGRSHNGTGQVIGRHTVIAARLPSGLCRKLCAAKLCIVALSMKAAN